MNFIKNFSIYFYMLPVILIGIIAMVANDVASSIWVMNLFIWLFGAVVGSALIKRNKNKEVKDVSLLTIFITLTIIVLPYLFPGIESVKRWITLGPLDIYIASIIIPLFIILLWRFTANNRDYQTLGLIIYALIVLLFQPDAGQLTALACATVLIIWKTIKSWLLKLIGIIVNVCFVVTSWIFLDDLAPVPYVEQILFLVAELGIIWLILGIISLLLFLLPFFLYGRNNIISLSLGIYFLVSILVTFFGKFPMPIMGYGVSPIIGYVIAISWLKRNQEDNKLSYKSKTR